MADSEKIAGIVASLVVPDKGAKADAVKKEAADKALDAILAAGKDGLVAVVGMLAAPGGADDSKARYALHALARRVTKDDRQRRAFAEALASTLGGDKPKAVQAFVVRQLQVAGGPESVAAVGKLLADDELYEPAAQALLAIKAGAAEQFRAALPRAEGKARVAIVHGLGTLRDAEAAGAIRPLVGSKDRDLHLTSLWALANAGDAASADTLMKTAMEGRGERVRTASACLLLAERLRAAGDAKGAARLLTHVRETFKGDDEVHFRDAAKRALGGMK